ncbi:hypothetical protein E4Z66_05370 [Aliishimia ponticola]|uniref:Lipoprotein n=1 Tax=Aliishimia ponticola TaxID=2499833 RepID=A0A4S4NH67_9RHOB|nr:hypothetical protein [Aliishimia ponticola]THH38989.1 hypothetical protein E4Z66_05370 [Aliishimia ponticola]
MRLFVGMMVCAVALSACQSRKDQIAFDGQFFRSKLSKVDGDRAQIMVTVKPVSASLEGAREAGRYEATRYCVTTFGNSAVDWVVGPDQAPETYSIENDTLVLRGACEG